jgi:ABC-type Na+ transport system ATPase subunit NatA
LIGVLPQVQGFLSSCSYIFLPILRRVAGEGRAVVIRSSEPEELVDLADEVHVVAGGQLVGSFAGDQLQAAALVAASASSGREGEAGASPGPGPIS